jgi:hypothetical protein
MWSELNTEQGNAEDWAREVEITSPFHVYMYTAASSSFLPTFTDRYCSVVQNNAELIVVMILSLQTKLFLQAHTEAHSSATSVKCLVHSKKLPQILYVT